MLYLDHRNETQWIFYKENIVFTEKKIHNQNWSNFTFSVTAVQEFILLGDKILSTTA